MYRDETGKQKQIVMIIRVCAILLMVFFFVLPLVRCTYEPDLAVSGWNVATGTGEVYELFGNRVRVVPVLFIFLIIPLALAMVTFLSIRPLAKYYFIQMVLAITGVLAKLYFIMEMNNRIRRAVGVESTGFHWLILLMYVGVAVLAGVAYYSNKQVMAGYGGGRAYSPKDGFYRGGVSSGMPYPPKDGFYRGGVSSGMPYPPEDAFCTRCGSPLHGGMSCRCSVSPREDYSHSYRTEKAFCTECGSPLHGGMPCRCSVSPREDYSHPYRTEKAFCTKCGDSLYGGRACGCLSTPDTFDSTVLVRSVSCDKCGRELYVGEECSCSPISSHTFCKECGRKLHVYEKCDCKDRAISGSKLKKTMKREPIEPSNRESFGKAGEL